MIASFWQFAIQDFAKRSTYWVVGALAVAIALNYVYDVEEGVLQLYDNTVLGVLGFFLLYFSFYLWVILCVKEQPNRIIVMISFWQLAFPTFLGVAFYQSCNLLQLLGLEYPRDYFHVKLYNRYDSLLIYTLMILLLGGVVGRSQFKNFGLFEFRFKARIYFYFLLAMVPLIAWAATQQDFLNQYPNLKPEYFDREDYLGYFLRFEPFYLLDFVGVEWYFRGFMILAFQRFLNEKTVLAAATIYCMFHFGKPILECVSSFFGGYILGYMSYKTKSIWGGIIVHMGVALLMDFMALVQIF